MKKQLHITLSVLSWLILANYSQQSSVNGTKKYDVNFTGTILTRGGELLDVENIAIGGRYKQIPVYEMPSQDNIDPQQRLLLSDPRDQKKNIITKLDLAEIAEIIVKDPVLWSYEKGKNYSIDFIEVEVHGTKNSAPKTYLIDTKSKITCDEISKSGPIEKIVPFPSIAKLTIKNYYHRDENPANQECIKQCQEKCEVKTAHAA